MPLFSFSHWWMNGRTNITLLSLPPPPPPPPLLPLYRSHHTSNANHRTRKIDDIFVLHSITPVSGDYDLDTKWNDATNIDLETAYEKEGFASILPTTQASKGEMVRLLSRKYKMARRTRDGQPLVHVDHDNFYQQVCIHLRN